MRRSVVVLGLFAVVALPLAAQKPKPAEDPIAVQLLKDKEAYSAALDAAKEDLLKAFDKQYELVKGNKKLKLAVQIATLEQLEAEKKAFDESGKLPTSDRMKVALSEYRLTLRKAHDRCADAFETAAKAYRDKGDIKVAAATLDEMKAFLNNDPSTVAKTFLIVLRHSGKVIAPVGDEKSAVLTAELVKGDEHQLWTSQHVENGWYYIFHKKSGLYLDGSERDVTIRKKNPTLPESQLWRFAPVADSKDAFKFFVRNGSAMGVASKLRSAGARMLMGGDENAPWMQFIMMPPFLSGDWELKGPGRGRTPGDPACGITSRRRPCRCTSAWPPAYRRSARSESRPPAG